MLVVMKKKDSLIIIEREVFISGNLRFNIEINNTYRNNFSIDRDYATYFS